MSFRVKRGDTAVVISGKNKGQRGEVERVLPKEGRVVISGVNVMTRHAQPTQSNPDGWYDFEAPLHLSNVMPVDPETGEPTRVGHRIAENGQKIRVSKKSGKDMDG